MRAETLSIAFATQEYVTENNFDGGIANHVHRVAKALAGLGHDVHVVTLSVMDRAEFVHEGVKVHRVPFGRMWLLLNRLTRYRLTATMHQLALSSQVYLKLRRLNARRSVDLVQFPNCSYCGLFSMLFLSVPHVLRASWYKPAYDRAGGIVQNLDGKAVAWLELLQCRLSRHIYTPSYTLRRTLLEEARLRHVRVIRPPVYMETGGWDYSVYERLLRGKKYLLFFGRFERRKGFHTLAQALPRLLERYADAHAVLVGRDGESALSPSSAEYARECCGRMAERLIILDSLPHERLYPVVEGARLVALPSLADNLPNACLEAMALRRPVIGTAGASFDELITDGESGFLVPAGDVAALAAKMIDAWEHPRLGEIGRAARRKMLEFAPEKTLPALLDYYREVLGG